MPFEVSLRSNKILRRFELVVCLTGLGDVPHLLHEALTSISSPHFSEFSLRLLHLFESNRNSGDQGPLLLETGWEVVDEDLYACAARRSDFRFVVEIPSEGLTEAAVEALFPRMKSKGSLLIKWRQQETLDQW